MTGGSNHPRSLHEQVRGATRSRRLRELLLASPGLGLAALAGVAETRWLGTRFDLDGIELGLAHLVSSVVIFSVVRAAVGWVASRRQP